MYRYLKITLAGILFLYTAILINCLDNNSLPTIPQTAEQVAYFPEPTPQEKTTFYTDITHQYEFWTGESSDYEYNYNVIGTDRLGNLTTPKVSMGKYGAGC